MLVKYSNKEWIIEKMKEKIAQQLLQETKQLIKVRNVNFTLFCFIKSENIIPAKAPIGVKNAPMLLPIIEAYTACCWAIPFMREVKFVNNMLIGMLLIKLLTKNDEKP